MSKKKLLQPNEFIRFLKSQLGFKESQQFDNRHELIKDFYKGIIIKVTIFKSRDVDIYYFNAYFDFTKLFPKVFTKEKSSGPQHFNVGKQFTGPHAIECPAGLFDLGRFQEIYNQKRKEFREAVEIVKGIPNF